jgi:hypothetical protein
MLACRYRLLQWTPIVQLLLHDALLAAALRTDISAREKFAIFVSIRTFISCCKQTEFDAAALHCSWHSVCSVLCSCCNGPLSASVVIDIIKSLVPSAAISSIGRFDSILPVAAMQPSALWLTSGRPTSQSWAIAPPSSLSSCDLLLKMNAIFNVNWSMVGTESDYDVPAWACPTAAVIKGSFFPLAILSLSPYPDAREAIALCMSLASKPNFNSDHDFDAAVKGVWNKCCAALHSIGVSNGVEGASSLMPVPVATFDTKDNINYRSWPLLDRRSLALELKVITAASNIVASTRALEPAATKDIAALLQLILQFISHGACDSARPPADFVLYQQTAWTLQSCLSSSSSNSPLAAIDCVKNLLVASWVSFHSRSWNYSGSNCATACGSAVFPYQVPVSKQRLLLPSPPSSGLYAASSGPAASMGSLLLDLANSCTLADRSNVAAALSSLSDHIMHSDTINHAAHRASAVACAFLIEIIQAMPEGPHEGIISMVVGARDVLLQSSSSVPATKAAISLPSLASTLDTLTLHLRSWGDASSPTAINATLSSLAICHNIIFTRRATSQQCASLLVCVGLSRLNLTLPSVPIDPSARYRVKASALLSASSEMHTLSTSTQAVASAVTAFISGALTRSLSSSARELSSSAAAASKLQVQRPMPDAFEPLFSDLSSVSTSLCSIERVMQVCPIVILQVRNHLTPYRFPFNCFSQAESSNALEWIDWLPNLRHMAADDISASKSWIDSTSAAVASLTIKHAAYADVALPAAAAIAMMRDGVNVFINEIQRSSGALEDATLAMLQFPWNSVTSDASIQSVLKQNASDNQTISGSNSSSTSRLRCIVEMLLAHCRRCCSLRQEHVRAGLMMKTLLEM